METEEQKQKRINEINQSQVDAAYKFMQKHVRYRQTTVNGQKLADLVNEQYGPEGWSLEALEDCFFNNLTEFDLLSSAELQKLQAPRQQVTGDDLPWRSPLTHRAFKTLPTSEVREILAGPYGKQFWDEFQRLMNNGR